MLKRFARKWNELGGGVNPRPQTPHGKPVIELETTLQDILVENMNMIYGSLTATSLVGYHDIS